MRYRYRVLGGTQALGEDGAVVPLGGARLRALVAALAVAGGRSVRTEALVREVWGTDAGGEPPADEVGALQALVGRLRRVLGRDAVGSADGGYRLVVAERDDIDLHRFERLAGEGKRALTAGAAAKAAELLDEALELWRGPALADLPDGGGAAGVRAGARHREARRDRLEAELQLGAAESALPALRALAAEDPLDEPLQALQLRALRDTGRWAEALSRYEEVRTAIADRLGTGPGPELRALHAELLTSGAGAPGVPGASRGTGGSGVPGGPGVPGHVSGTPPAGGAVRGNLRAQLTSFVGREREVEAVRADLARARLVTLTGPGGSGKTRLSQEAAAGLTGDWPDGVWVAELAPVRDPGQLAEAVLTALGGRETVLRGSTAEGLHAVSDPHALDPLAQLAEHCAHRRMLLVLDNCEHLIAAAAQLAETLLVACPQLTVLATSREPLGVAGECVRPVEPLPEPVALRLLGDRGAAARPGFEVAADPEACAEVCRRLDGLPLAIELAAARLRALTPRQLADRLDDRFRLLTGGRRTGLARQQTLRAVVDWSWELLEEPERAVLRRLSVFSGGCALEQAEAVCGDGGPVSPRDVPGVLASLVDKSLVLAAASASGAYGTAVDGTAPGPGTGAAAGPGGDGTGPADAVMRYGLLETVAEYAAERLDEVPGEREAAERRHLVAYRELARTTDPLLRGPDQLRHCEVLEREHDNVRAALRRAVDRRDEQEALCLVLSMCWFWQLRDHRSDAATWTRAAAALGPDPFAGPVTPAPALTERCTDAPPPMRPELLWEARREVRLLELTAIEPDRDADGPPRGERSERLRRAVSAYAPWLPQSCRLPGLMWVFGWMLTGELSRAREVLDAVARGCREHGYDWELAFVLQLRGKFFNELRGELERSVRDADESLAIFRRLGDEWGVAEALAGRAEARCLRGEFAAGADDYRAAIDRATRLAAHSHVPLLTARLGGALVESADAAQRAEGEELMRAAVAESAEVTGDRPDFASLQYALYLGGRGRTAEARRLLEPAEDRLRGREPEVFHGMVSGLLAWLLCLDREYAPALAKAAEAIALTRGRPAETLAPSLVTLQFLTAARALAAIGDPVVAARLIGAYDASAYGNHGHTVGAADRESREAAESAVRAALRAAGADAGAAYERAYAEGGGLSKDEAAELVRRALPGESPSSRPTPPS